MNPKAPALIGRDWITTPPLAADAFVGRVTIALFWSVGCEASRVRLLELDRLAERLPASLSVVAVHTPRFAFEQDRQVVEDFVTRIGLNSPVLHDPDLLTWARYDPGGWPATIAIDPRGRVLGASLGLDSLEPLAEAADLATRKWDRRRQSSDPIPIPAATPPGLRPGLRGLSWPSGLAVLPADPDGGERLAVADSGNQRVLVLSLDDHQRSASLTAAFDRLPDVADLCASSPTSLAVSIPSAGTVLTLNLATGNVERLAAGFERPRGLTMDLDDTIVVADSGDNQLIRIGPDGTLGVLAGTGFTGHTDGPARWAELAQPVAVARVNSGLAFLDAATSNLRLLTDEGQVHTVTGNSFEKFGLVDGTAHRASLQRPGGLCRLPDDRLVIVDSGNSRIRLLQNRRLRTLGLAGLRQPEAVTAIADRTGRQRLVIADTGNHRLLVADPETNTAWKLQLPPLD